MSTVYGLIPSAMRKDLDLPDIDGKPSPLRVRAALAAVDYLRGLRGRVRIDDWEGKARFTPKAKR